MQAKKYYNKRNTFFTSKAAVVFSLVLGIALGVAVSMAIPKETLLAICDMSDVFALLAEGKWLSVFFKFFILAEVFVAVAYLCGFGAIFQPVVLILCTVRGVGLGVCARGIYLNGNPLADMAAFLPFAIASTLVILAQAKLSIKMAGYYFSLTLTNENRLGVKTEIHDYTAKFAVLSIVLAILSALNCLLFRLVESAL